MPVEESGNILILMDAIAHAERNAHFAAHWWRTLTKWAKFLEQFGPDPADQLCTDDFMGHLAHNANLSIKAILGLAAYGDLCRIRGNVATAHRYAGLANVDAAHWMKVADGGPFLAGLRRPGTWSQKYNLVWDKILGLKVFPPKIAQREITQYKKMADKFGVPLDSRTTIAETPWSVWCATLADNRDDFQALIAPLHTYFDETTTRDPLSDSYVANDPNSSGMHARPVVGAVFSKMLADPAVWKKWASLDMQQVGGGLPSGPARSTEVVPTSINQPIMWPYTTTANPPGKTWFDPKFDDIAWNEGPGGFGSYGTPSAVVRTVWTDTPGDIWIRRAFTLPHGKVPPDLQIYAYHDEDMDVYINGVLAVSVPGFVSSYQPYDMSDAARAALMPTGKNVLAVHCHQTTGAAVHRCRPGNPEVRRGSSAW